MRSQREQLRELHAAHGHEQAVEQRADSSEQAVELHGDAESEADQEAPAEVALVDTLGIVVEHRHQVARPCGRLLGEELVRHHDACERGADLADAFVVVVLGRIPAHVGFEVCAGFVATDAHVHVLGRLGGDAGLEGRANLVGQTCPIGGARDLGHGSLDARGRQVGDERRDDVLAGPGELHVLLGCCRQRLVVDTLHVVVEVEELPRIVARDGADHDDDVGRLVVHLDDGLDELLADGPADRQNRVDLPFRVGLDHELEAWGLESGCHYGSISVVR